MKILLVLPLLVASCALTRKSASIDVRYFAPVLTAPTPSSPAVAGPAPALDDLRLRLGRVDAASYLRAKIAYRESTHEVGYYDTLRWTEDPDAYLRRALARALFEERGISEVVSGIGPTLEIELSAFDEVRTPRPSARIEVTWKLRSGREVLAQRTLAVSRPMANASPEALARAMGGALGEVVETVVSDVLAELARSAPPAAP